MQIVRDFFASDRAISMELPDGWFGGRPYDNQHELTFIAIRPHKLILELDRQVYLIFTEAQTVESRGGRLIVEDFDQVVLDRQGYGDMTAHVSVYDRGCVTFHAGGGVASRSMRVNEPVALSDDGPMDST